MKRCIIASGMKSERELKPNLRLSKDIYQLVTSYLGCNALFNALRINRDWYHLTKGECIKNKQTISTLILTVPSCVQKKDMKNFFSEVVQGVTPYDGDCAFVCTPLTTSITWDRNQVLYFNLLRIRLQQTEIGNCKYVIPGSLFVVCDHDRIKNCFAIRCIYHSKTFACVGPRGQIELVSAKHIISIQRVISATHKAIRNISEVTLEKISWSAILEHRLRLKAKNVAMI